MLLPTAVNLTPPPSSPPTCPHKVIAALRADRPRYLRRVVGAAAAEGPGAWACPACTLANGRAAARCGACDAARPPRSESEAVAGAAEGGVSVSGASDSSGGSGDEGVGREEEATPEELAAYEAHVAHMEGQGIFFEVRALASKSN